MKLFLSSVLILSAAASAICPLGFPPDDACPVDAPSCTLYADKDSDSYCDNPEPGADESSDTDDSSPDTTAAPEPEEPLVEPDSSDIEEQGSEASDEAVNEDEQAAPPVPAVEPLPPDTVYLPEWDSFDVDTTGIDITADIVGDSVIVDTLLMEEIEVPLRECPLDLDPAEACPEEDPRCTFYTDADLNFLCDNPGEPGDTLVATGIEIHDTVYPLDILNGCPLELPPAAACPTAESALCPHYMGGEGCINPVGGGMNRAVIVLMATAVLLPVSTCLRRRLRGRRPQDKRRRKIAHITVYIVSVAVLGFVVQGCYCQLGIIQYLFLPGGLSFLGGLGLLIIILPMIWAVVYGRVFCGWVCPFGALQSLLGHLNVPRPPRLPGRIQRYLIYQKYVLAVLFFLAVFLAGRGVFGRLVPAALWCQVDPFHTVFSFFLAGSFFGGIVLITLAIFLPRFFCKYLCFYGALLSLLGRVRLYPRLMRKTERQKNSNSCLKPG